MQLTHQTNDERGSLALEQVLFIGAVVTMGAGILSFYDDLSNYFRNFTVATPPTNVGATSTNS